MLLICGVVLAFLFIYLFIYHSARGRFLSDRRPTFFGCLTSGILSANIPPSPDVSHSEFCLAAVPPSPDVSHPEFCPADVPPSPDISHLAPDVGWERMAFQLPRSDISGSFDSSYPESFAAILHSAAVFS